MSKAPYVIMAPEYRHNSAGVRVMHKLRDLLEERGYHAEIATAGQAPDSAIAVYPETVSGNPLGGKTVVRYVLFFPGKLGGDEAYDQNEIIFTYDSRYYRDVPRLKISIIEDFFRNEGLPRSGGCFYVGKGKDVPRIPETDGLTEITRAWPEKRTDLARLLNECEVFYTYDQYTAMADEAELCGCRVVVIGGRDKGDPIDTDKQLDEFIRITQAAAPQAKDVGKISFGVLVNDINRLDMCLRQSEIEGEMHTINNPSSATKGLNMLLDLMEKDGADVAILVHQDMYFRQAWLPQVRARLAELPESWIVAGIIGKGMDGKIKGRLHDMRVPLLFNYGPLPCEAACFDECVIIVNLKKGFRFDESLEGFDLYGSLCCLQAEEMGGTAWIIDAFAEHYCMRPFTWYPDKVFEASFRWLHQRFPGARRIDSTVIGVPREVPDDEFEKENAA